MSNKTYITWHGDEAVLSQWYFENGSTVQDGDVVCELSVEKTVIEVEAPISGTIEILIAEIDTVVTPGTVLGAVY